MKIAFVSPYPPSRVTLNEYGYHLIRSFVGKAEVEKMYVLTNHLEDNSAYSRYATEGVDIIPCWRFNSIASVWNIAKTLKQLNADVVIMNLQFMTFGEDKIPSALGLLTPWVCKLMNIPSIVILHNITETVRLDSIGMAGNKIKENILLWIGTQLTKFILKADLVGLTISQYVDIIKDKYKANNVVLLPHGNFELPERSYLPEEQEEINLMAFGKFGTYKKVEVLLDAVSLLEKKYPNQKFKATIAGTDNPNVKGYLDGVKARYNDMNNIVFTGYVPEENVESIFKESSFVIFPYTTTTGSSGILHQAGSYARACILPKIDDLERVVEEEGYGGAYFETDNAESLAEAVAHLIEHPEERKKYEDMNYAAAKGLPMNELAQWYLLHAKKIIADNQKNIQRMLKKLILQLLNFFYPLIRKFIPFQVYAYLAVGAVNTLLNIGLFILCYQVFITSSFAVETATVISFVITVITGFWLQKNFAFTDAGNDKKDVQQQFGKYALVALQGQLSAYLLTKGMIVLLQFDASLAYGVTSVIMITVNYFLQKYYTFRSRKVLMK